MKNQSDTFIHNLTKQHIRMGVSPAFRPRLWRTCALSKKTIDTRGHYYLQLIKYEMEQKKNISTEQIERDLLRTFPDHPLYTTIRGISSLRRVLTAFSVHNSVIGYCQSMNFIGGLLLLFLDEEDAFWVFCYIMENLFPNNYTTELVGMQIDTQIVMCIAQEKLPKLMNHIENLSFPISDSISKWLLQLFVGILPIESVIRFFDLLLFEGTKVVIRFALAILKIHEQGLLNCSTFEDMWIYVDRAPSMVFNTHELVSVAMKGLGSFRSLNDLRVKCSRMVKKKVLTNAFEYSVLKSSLSETGAHKLMKAMATIAGASSVIDLEQWCKLAGGVWGQAVSNEVYSALFLSFQSEQGVGKMENALNVISILLKGSDEEKLYCLYRCFDHNNDNKLTQDEMSQMLSALFPTKATQRSSRFPEETEFENIMGCLEMMDRLAMVSLISSFKKTKIN
jgi:Ca2+-binding EF-hand superfamily protein